MKKLKTIPSYEFEATADPNLKRYVDRYGNWTHYYLVKEKRFLPAVNHILGLGFNKGPRFYQYLLSVTPEEAKQKLEAAGDEGTRTHTAIRQLIDGSKVTMTTKFPSDLQRGRQEVLNPDEWDNLIAFEAWCDRYKPRVVSNDFAVYSLVNEYAGSPDGLFIITVPSGDKAFPKPVWGQDVLFMPDWKTSSAIHNEYKAQLAAYLSALKERGTYKKFLEAFKGRIFTGNVRLGTRHKNGGYEMQLWTENQTATNFRLFLSAKNIYQDNVDGDTAAPVSVDVPMQFYIKVPKAALTKAKKTAKKKSTKLMQGKLPL